MVEGNGWNFCIKFFTGIHQHREGFNAARRKHRHQQRGLVATHAVAILKGDVHIVRLVAGGIFLGSDAHVADLLANKLKDRLDAFFVRGESVGNSSHFRLHFRRCRIQVRLGEFGIPATHFLPVSKCADA